MQIIIQLFCEITWIKTIVKCQTLEMVALNTCVQKYCRKVKWKVSKEIVKKIFGLTEQGNHYFLSSFLLYISSFLKNKRVEISNIFLSLLFSISYILNNVLIFILIVLFFPFLKYCIIAVVVTRFWRFKTHGVTWRWYK